MMADLDLAALDALFAKATKGSWYVNSDLPGGMSCCISHDVADDVFRPNAEFIVALVNAYPQLRAEREQIEDAEGNRIIERLIELSGPRGWAFDGTDANGEDSADPADAIACMFGYAMSRERERAEAELDALRARVADAEQDYRSSSEHERDDMRAARVRASAWQPIETAPHTKIVLVYYVNALGNGRTMRASFYPAGTLEMEDTESGFNAEDGWYEESEAYEFLMPLSGNPLFWSALPAPPTVTP